VQFHLSLGGIILILEVLHVQHSSLKTFWIGRRDFCLGWGLFQMGGDFDNLKL
jgi:hypothetical protein